MNIAIDGPAGAGKSTIARRVAKEKGYIYVDTGAMYRAIGLYFMNEGVDAENAAAVLEALAAIQVEIKYEAGEQQVYLNGKNVSKKIRQEAVGNMASKVATKQAVRDKLLDLQRNLAATQDVVMDGRDIGTFVLPNAELKIYLTASVDTRADRRYKELVEKHMPADLEEIKRDIEEICIYERDKDCKICRLLFRRQAGGESRLRSGWKCKKGLYLWSDHS